MTTLAAAVTCLGCVRAVLGDVARAVALVARDIARSAIVHRIGAVACPVAEFVALVASRIVHLRALLGDVPDAVAAIAALRLLGASTSEVPELVALVALFASTAATHVAVTTTAAITATSAAATTSGTITHAAGVAVSGKMARTVALVARGS